MRLFLLWLVTISIVITGCDKGSTTDPLGPQTIQIICPADTTIMLYSTSVPSHTIQLPVPMVVTDCSNGELTFNDNRPTEFRENTYTINYQVIDGCGNSATCQSKVIAVDYRRKFVGTYAGREISTDNYGQILVSDIYRDLVVSMGPADNGIIVDGDVVEVDSSGGFPYPSCCTYRFYSFRFWPDSMTVYKNYGPLGGAFEVRFRGKK